MKIDFLVQIYIIVQRQRYPDCMHFLGVILELNKSSDVKFISI